MKSFRVLPLLAALIASTITALPAMPQEIPRTPEGRPDFQGVWSNNWLTLLEKGGRYNTLVVTAEEAEIVAGAITEMTRKAAQATNDPDLERAEAKSLAIVRGDFRSHLIISPETGRLPLTPEGQRLSREFGNWARRRMMAPIGEGPEDRAVWERCLAGLGQAPLLYSWQVLGLRRIIQTPDALVINSEAGGETRIIRIGGEHLPDQMRSFLGDSTGRWDGDTLVVETVNFHAQDRFRQSIWDPPIAVGPGARVVERFSLASSGELNYQFSVEDPGIYSEPWLAEYSMMRTGEPMFEFACHEGNYGLPNILGAARESERLDVNAGRDR